MALSPLQRLFWPRLREQQHLRRYRQHLLERNVLTRSTPLLSHLDRLPLTLRPAGRDAERHSLAQALHSVHRIRIVNPLYGGRSLVLRQFCLHWAQERAQLDQCVPLLVDAAPGQGAPADVLLERLGEYGFDADILQLRRGLAGGQLVLLLDSWEALSAHEQAAWRDWLVGNAERYPAFTAVVITGPGSEPWPLFEDWLIDGWEV
ncbi:MAG TPA: hypothetical protein VGE07_25785 [Herpetosiphonaceae bacterium]